MSVILSLKAGGGGVFVGTFHSGVQRVDAGASGNFISLTPPAGERVRLNILTVSGNSSDTNYELTVNGSVVAGGAGVLFTAVSTTANAFTVRNTYQDATFTGQGAATVIDPIIGGVDEVVVFRKTSGTTPLLIVYSYSFGVIK